MHREEGGREDAYMGKGGEDAAKLCFVLQYISTPKMKNHTPSEDKKIEFTNFLKF